MSDWFYIQLVILFEPDWGAQPKRDSPKFDETVFSTSTFVATIPSRDLEVIIRDALSGAAMNLHKILFAKEKGRNDHGARGWDEGNEWCWACVRMREGERERKKGQWRAGWL